MKNSTMMVFKMTQVINFRAAPTAKIKLSWTEDKILVDTSHSRTAQTGTSRNLWGTCEGLGGLNDARVVSLSRGGINEKGSLAN